MLPRGWELVRLFAVATCEASEARLVLGVSSRLQRLSAVDLHTGSAGAGGRSGELPGRDACMSFAVGTSHDAPSGSSVSGSRGDQRARLRLAGTDDSVHGPGGFGDSDRRRGAGCGPNGTFTTRMAQRANGLIAKAASPEQALVFMAKHVGNDPFYRALAAAAGRRWPSSKGEDKGFGRTFINVELGIDGDGDEAAHLMECCLPAGVKHRVRRQLSQHINNSLDWYGTLGRADSYVGDDPTRGMCSLCGRVWECWGYASKPLPLEDTVTPSWDG